MADVSGAPAVRHLLVVIPNWVGDVVMATPILAALRAQLAGARITYLLRPYVSEVLAGGGWHDAELHWPVSGGLGRLGSLIGAVRRAGCDAVLLLTNSWRSAFVPWAAGVPRRVGYARDGRAWMLTDRLRPLRLGGDYVPVPILPYYADLAERLGVRVTDRRLRLGVTDEQETAGRQLAEHHGWPARYAVINPGAAFGAAKCWLPERFAEVCDRLTDELDLRPVIVGAPGEVPLMERIAGLARRSPVVCAAPGTTLGSLKAVIRGANLLVCNDTGPRHYGQAFGVPTVTVFGPTYQEWTDTDWPGEIKLQAEVPCGPCQLKRCPLDHACMTRVTADEVLTAARRLLAAGGATTTGAAQVRT